MECWKGVAWMLGTAVVLSACFPSVRTPESIYGAAAAIPSDLSEEDGEADRLEQLVLYAARTRRLPPPGLQSEYAAAREAHQRAPDSYTRLRLAILIGSPNAPFRDDISARELLYAAARDASTDGATRGLAALWLHDLDERIALERALDEQRRQRQALQQKLEQLRTIEEEIDRRPTTPIVPSR